MHISCGREICVHNFCLILCIRMSVNTDPDIDSIILVLILKFRKLDQSTLKYRYMIPCLLHHWDLRSYID